MQKPLTLLAVLCLLAIAARSGSQDKPSGITVDKDKKLVVIDAKIAPRKLDVKVFKGIIYPIEVIACYPYPEGKKAHETVVTMTSKPSDVHKALQSLGLKPGTPVMGESKEPPQGPEVNIYLEFAGPDGAPKRITIDRALLDPKTNKPLPKSVRWRFTGSVMSQPDPNKPEKVYGADLTGTLISIFPVTNQTVFQTNLTLKEEKYLKLETNKEVLPKEGTPCKLIFEVAKQ